MCPPKPASARKMDLDKEKMRDPRENSGAEIPASVGRSPNRAASADDRTWLAREIRTYDRDRWLSVLLAPPAFRDDLLALYAFNLELARTRERVSEPMLGQMRLQWWRDVVDAIAAGTEPAGNAAVTGLAHAMRTRTLNPALLHRMIDARETDLAPEGPPDLPSLYGYAEWTGAPVLALALGIVGAPAADAEAAAEPVGTAWALTGLLRAIPFFARQRRCLLPADGLAAAGVTEIDLFEGRAGAALVPLVREIAAEAGDLLQDGRKAQRSLPRAMRSPLALATLARAYLGDLARVGYDPFLLPSPSGALPLRLAWAKLQGRY